MSNIYLDHSATTPLDPRVLATMLPYFTDNFGNASSGHRIGKAAEKGLLYARETVASILNCQPSEIVFTSGGTESDNLAVRGAAWHGQQTGKGNHLITTPLEHDAIGKTINQLVQFQGFTQTILPVDHSGRVTTAAFDCACRSDTSFASIMYANNEVGTVQDIPELAAIARAHGVIFHTDAVQAAGQLSLDVQQLGVDLLSLSAHKFYGPKGVGALFIRSGFDLITAQTGGSQEQGRRGGTYNTPGIVGLAKALELAYEDIKARTDCYQLLRDRLINGILVSIPQAQLSGHPEQRLPSHASFVFNDLDSGALLEALDLYGIAASAASACKAGNPKPSGVLLALGYSYELASSSLRLTLGAQTTESDIDQTILALSRIVNQINQTESVLATV